MPAPSRKPGIKFADPIRSVTQDRIATPADQMSTLIDLTGYCTVLRESRAETTEGRLENV